MNRLTRWLGVTMVGLIAADWLLKLWIVRTIPFGDTRTVWDGWFYLLHRRNTGVAFGMLTDLPDAWRMPLLVGLSVVGVVLFWRMLVTAPDRLTRVACALVIAGAIGNLGDRLLNGHVTDYLYVSFFPFVFNFADAAISVGGALLVVALVFFPEPASAPAAAEPTSS